jgi:hypothetical protein
MLYLWLMRLIVRVEEGRFLRYFLAALAVAGLILGYNLRNFQDMSNPEAMDNAQLARNLAEHKGYTTFYVRPFSFYLLQRAAEQRSGPQPLGGKEDRGQLLGMHPDLANPPVYPLVLAGLMKILPPARYQVAGDSKLINPKLWNRAGGFWIYPPDFIISLFNQALFFACVVMVFFLARKLFDGLVAWTSAALFFGTDLFWRFSMSGLSTMLVMLIFLTLAWCLLRLECGIREGNWAERRQLLAAAGIGALTAFGCLTRYSFGWLIIAVVMFLFFFAGPRRIVLCVAALAVFALVLSPWLVRNYRLSHTLFGTAQYAVYETTTHFPEYRLERSLNPDLSRVTPAQLWFKLVANTRAIVEEQLPRLGGNWVSAFFLVGLLVVFQNTALSRLRYFVLFCLPVLVIVQALGRTQLSDDSPVFTSENLLVLISPLIIIFGAGFFFILLDRISLPAPVFRYPIIGGFCALVCLPAILNFFGPRTNAAAYPPYDPPQIQRICNWMKEDDLTMSDIPWAVAWYGNRQSMWLTLDAQNEFSQIYDYEKRVKAIYLTPVTMDARFLTQWVRASEHSWGSFVHDSIVKKEMPPNFPLRRAPAGFLPEQFFVTDIDRWSKPQSPLRQTTAK